MLTGVTDALRDTESQVSRYFACLFPFRWATYRHLARVTRPVTPRTLLQVTMGEMKSSRLPLLWEYLDNQCGFYCCL